MLAKENKNKRMKLKITLTNDLSVRALDKLQSMNYMTNLRLIFKSISFNVRNSKNI